MENNWFTYSSFIGRAVSCAMKERGLTQTALASMLGCSQQYVSRIVRGSENLTLETVSKLESVLGLRIYRYPVPANDMNLLREEPHASYASKAKGYPHSASQSTSIIQTGDRPFKLLCDDGHNYLCKYNRFSGSSNALAREYIGSCFARIWGLSDAPMTPLSVSPDHLPDGISGLDPDIPMLGRRWTDGMVDVNNSTSGIIGKGEKSLSFILTVSLFDLWLANEDRTANNSNLLYSPADGGFAAIDHAGIFNTSLKAPLMQLDTPDSLLYSEIAGELLKTFADVLPSLLNDIKEKFGASTSLCETEAHGILSGIPEEWRIGHRDLNEIITFIFSDEWINLTWDNFTRIIEEVR